MPSVAYYSMPNSLVAEKNVCDGKTTWSLLNKTSSNGDKISLEEEYVDFILEVPSFRTFINLKDMMIVRHNGKVVLMFKEKVSMMETSTWNLFLDTIIGAQRGLLSPCARSAKRMAKLILYQTFYEHFLTDALTRHELTSFSNNEKLFFDRLLHETINKKDFLKGEYKQKLWDLDLHRFEFLYKMTNADENFGPKLYKYCRDCSLDGVLRSYDTVL